MASYSGQLVHYSGPRYILVGAQGLFQTAVICTLLPKGDGQKGQFNNLLKCPRGLLDHPGSMEKLQIVCQMTLSQTLLFEPPRAHSRATWMSERVPKVMDMLLGMAVAKVACNMATTSLGSMW